jgi:protein O-mannosyl-transferase
MYIRRKFLGKVAAGSAITSDAITNTFMSSFSGSETDAPRANRASQNLSITELIRLPWVMELLLAAGTFLVFCGTLAFGFVYDDRMQILDNVSITRWSFVPQYFTGNVWALIDPHILANYYRPLFLLWLRLNYSLFGLNPTGWHALSVALHVIVVVQVFWLGRRLLRTEWAAALAAALFAVHPVHIESVTWISGATDPMLAIFLLASTLAFLRYLDEIGSGQGGKWAYAASLVFFGLALLSKEVAVMLPFMLLPIALYARKQQTTIRDIGLAAVPYFLLMAVYLLVRQYALSGFSHPLHRLSTRSMILTWPAVMALYARQLIAPFWISPYLNVHWVTALNRDFWAPLAICIALLAGAGVLWKWSSDRRLLSALYAWILLPLLPVLYIKVFSGSEIAHDRYLYVSSVGFCILVVAIVRAAAKRVALRIQIWKAIGAAAIVLLMTMTISGELYWASDLLLFKHALEVAPENEAAILNLGISYAEHQRPDLAAPLLKSLYDRNPKLPTAAYNYGELLARTGQWHLAEPIMRRALELDPRNDRWWIEFSNVEFTLGKIAEAQTAAREAARLRPDAPGYHAVIGVLATKLGDRETAEKAFHEELKRYPDNPVALSGLKELDSHK